jgi:hypothetical protein
VYAALEDVEDLLDGLSHQPRDLAGSGEYPRLLGVEPLVGQDALISEFGELLELLNHVCWGAAGGGGGAGCAYCSWGAICSW